MSDSTTNGTDPSLFDHASPPIVVPVTNPSALTIDEQFERFHTANPWVYNALVKLAFGWHAKGHRHAAIGMLFEVLRWEHGRATEGDQFKLNNNYRSRYARLIMTNHPELNGMFHTRTLTS